MSKNAPLKLFIGIPVYREMEASFAQCLINLHLAPPCDEFLVCPLVGDSLVSRARNTITANFLATDATHLLWLDSDLVFSPEHVKRLVSHDKDIVGGFYPKKQEGPLRWVCNAYPQPQPVQPDGLQRIRYAGTGFMVIRRQVFERMIATYGDALRYRADESGREEYDFWSVGVHQFEDGSRRYLSEDWFFCQRWLDLGGEIWGDTKVVIKHTGAITFPLASQMAELRG